MPICWLLGQQKYVALVLVQSEAHHYDYFRVLALRNPTFFSLGSLIMVAIIGFKTGRALAFWCLPDLLQQGFLHSLRRVTTCLLPHQTDYGLDLLFFPFSVWDLECSY